MTSKCPFNPDEGKEIAKIKVKRASKKAQYVLRIPTTVTSISIPPLLLAQKVNPYMLPPQLLYRCHHHPHPYLLWPTPPPSYGTHTTPSYGGDTTPSCGTHTTPSYGTHHTTSLSSITTLSLIV